VSDELMHSFSNFKFLIFAFAHFTHLTDLSCFVHSACHVLSTLLSGFVNFKICICLRPAANLDVMEIFYVMLYAEKNLPIILVIVLTILLVITVIRVFNKRIEYMEMHMKP
jgi:hypothetical protein